MHMDISGESEDEYYILMTISRSIQSKLICPHLLAQGCYQLVYWSMYNDFIFLIVHYN